MAPSTASNKSASIDSLCLPPDSSSPLLKNKKFPVPNFLDIFAKIGSLTTIAFILAKFPSEAEENFLYKYSATIKSKTASPRSSNLSLLIFLKALFSLPYDL